MKYKIGDKVKIKSLDWYNANKDADGHVMMECGLRFAKSMIHLCGKTMEIKDTNEDESSKYNVFTILCVEYDGFSFWISTDCIEQSGE